MYSGHRAVIGILTSTHQTKFDVLRCMESCQGYPIWVHDNSNDNFHIDLMKNAVKDKCHYFSSSVSNGMPGLGKNRMMQHFGMDTNLRFFDYCFMIDGDDVWGDTMPKLFKKQFTGDFLFTSGGKMEWQGETLKADGTVLAQKIMGELEEEFKRPDTWIATMLEMEEMVNKFYQHPKNEKGTLNRLIGFHKGSYHKLKFKEDLKVGEDIIFMMDAYMMNKRKELKLQYIHDDELYRYMPNERGLYMYSFTRPKEKWIETFKSYLPPTAPRKKIKVDWVE
jgi:hypothetical protein